jgi:hypothetical protein
MARNIKAGCEFLGTALQLPAPRPSSLSPEDRAGFNPEPTDRRISENSGKYSARSVDPNYREGFEVGAW